MRLSSSLALALLLASCAQLGIPTAGSGVRAEVERDVDGFQSVVLATHADVTVRIGAASSLVLSGDDDLLEHVTSRVRHGQLTIELDGRYRFRAPLKVDITAPRLTSVSVEGSGTVQVEGVAEKDFTVSIEGSGDVVAAGEVDRLDASIEGSGDLRLRELRAVDASVSISGSGAARVNATRALRYRIEGSGEVTYVGSPEVSGGISGSGTVGKE